MREHDQMKIPCNPKNNNVWILNIGTELLMGVTVNTNASWIARKLAFLGYNIKRIIVVPDTEDDVKDEIKRGINKNAGLIITTGGLGPTYDDNTAKFISNALNRKLEKNKEAYQMVLEKYRAMGEQLTPYREKMAFLPEGSQPIPNDVGTAPGFVLCEQDTLIISFPGVPREMKSIFENYIEPALKKISNRILIDERIVIKGIKESSLAPIVEYLAKKYLNAYIKSHPKGYESDNPVIELQITVTTRNKEEGIKLIEEIKRELYKRISQ